MRPPVVALRAHLRRSTQEAREAIADGLYDLEKVRLALTTRASEGFEFAVIEAPDGLDLRHTQAGKAAKERLENEKLHVAWEARAGGLGEDGASSYSLVVSWQMQALNHDPAPGDGAPDQRETASGAEGGAAAGGVARARAAGDRTRA